MKLNMEMDRKTVILIAGAAAAGMISFLAIGPLSGKVRRAAREVMALDNELAAVREAFKGAGRSGREGRLLTRAEVSGAIDEMTNAGAVLNINFLSTSPQQIEKPKGSKYSVLPIRMELQSEYKDLGLFLGALEGLKESIVTVKSFRVKTSQEVLPQVKTELVVEIYLKEGEGG